MRARCGYVPSDPRSTPSHEPCLNVAPSLSLADPNLFGDSPTRVVVAVQHHGHVVPDDGSAVSASAGPNAHACIDTEDGVALKRNRRRVVVAWRGTPTLSLATWISNVTAGLVCQYPEAPDACVHEVQACVLQLLVTWGDGLVVETPCVRWHTCCGALGLFMFSRLVYSLPLWTRLLSTLGRTQPGSDRLPREIPRVGVCRESTVNCCCSYCVGVRGLGFLSLLYMSCAHAIGGTTPRPRGVGRPHTKQSPARRTPSSQGRRTPPAHSFCSLLGQSFTRSCVASAGVSPGMAPCPS